MIPNEQRCGRVHLTLLYSIRQSSLPDPHGVGMAFLKLPWLLGRTAMDCTSVLPRSLVIATSPWQGRMRSWMDPHRQETRSQQSSTTMGLHHCPRRSCGHRRPGALAARSSLQGTVGGAVSSESMQPCGRTKEALPLPPTCSAMSACRATEVAKVRVSQAAAQGIPPRLEDLLVDESWRAALAAEFKKSYMTQLATFLSAEWKAQTIYPPQPLVFRSVSQAADHDGISLVWI